MVSMDRPMVSAAGANKSCRGSSSATTTSKQQVDAGDGSDEAGGGAAISSRKGPWREEEDVQLIRFVQLLGERRWDFLAKVSGLKRTGKSCRLRWVNYLHPGLKRGRMTADEERLVLQLHAKWGNRWSRIAKSMPGRTDNEIKNYWRTHTRKINKQQLATTASACSSSSNNDQLVHDDDDHLVHSSTAPASQELVPMTACMDQLLPVWDDHDMDAHLLAANGMGMGTTTSGASAMLAASPPPVWDAAAAAYFSDSLWAWGIPDDC